MTETEFLYKGFNFLSENGYLIKEIPWYVAQNLNDKFQIRDYQIEAFARFVSYFSKDTNRIFPVHLLFNMATWSGKTFVMANLILELWSKGYRNFLFLVNSTNIIEKTKENFLNSTSSKYLFAENINFDGKNVVIREVNNFADSSNDAINIKFTTIQGLHSDLNTPKENGITYEDFKQNKTVILSDEAHHINASTKKWISKEQTGDASWENTVVQILDAHAENVMLEFTATLDLSNEAIKEKYKDKIIYKYDLKNFRADGYSKEVDILKSDISKDQRILQALILSQYRLKIAEKNWIFCKPVILFKAQKTIAESQKNLEEFNGLIKDLQPSHLEKIKESAGWTIIATAFQFFDNNQISLENLVKELKEDFAPECCLSANDDKEAAKNQILLNTLEDRNNHIRAIFAVQKLNEWWDVLNLFDIVRLYESRSNVLDKKTGKVKVWPQTISEAQLIGRGARYFPFSVENWDDKYKRKFDNKNDELKILETFYYHTTFDNQYISEIKQALIQVGLLDSAQEKTKFTLKLKDEFKESTFYKSGVIFVNERVAKGWTEISSLTDIWFTQKEFEYQIFSWWTSEVKIFDDTTINAGSTLQDASSIQLSEIDKRIIKKAIAKNPFYHFDNLKKYFGQLNSIDQFITDSNYLDDLTIKFKWVENIDSISIEDKLSAIMKLLQSIELCAKKQYTPYCWSKKFNPRAIKEVFLDKECESKGDIIELREKNWSPFVSITGTSEEKSFIEFFSNTLLNKLKEKKNLEYIYLLRSERAFALYDFDEWRRFEPDFVLFMKEKNSSSSLTYQVFIEPKGAHLLVNDAWKNKFLQEIADGATISEQAEILQINLDNYKIIGLPFYNEKNPSQLQAFKDAFNKKLWLKE